MTTPEQIGAVREYYKGTADSYESWHPNFYHFGHFPSLFWLINNLYRTRSLLETNRRSIDTLTHKIVQFANIEAGDKVLDAGCGVGGVTRLLEEHGVEAYGINIVPHQLRLAVEATPRESFPHIHFSMQDFAQTAFPSGFFDKVMFVDCLTHASDKEEVMRETVRVLNPDKGTLVVTDIFQTPSVQNQPSEELSKLEGGMKIEVAGLDDFISLLKSLGFKSIDVQNGSRLVLPTVFILAVTNFFAQLTNKNPNLIKKGNREALVALSKLMLSKRAQYHLIRAKFD